MKRALIIGNSGGIGSAVQHHLLAGGVDVVGLSRSADGLDLTNERSIETVLADLDGTFDTVLVATGALQINGAAPEKSLRTVEADALATQYAVNAIGPLLVLKHAVRVLPRRERAVFGVLSARVGSIGDNRMGGWFGYRAAKAGLNQLIHSAAVELGRSHKHLCVACLHPGTVATDFTKDYQTRHPTVTPSQAASQLVDVLTRLTPEQSGGFYDYALREIPW